MTVQQKLATADKLIAEVSVLRGLQKDYFKYRDLQILDKCKIQERKVDAMISEYFDNQTKLPFPS